MNSRDAERQELERAIELLGRSTRHARLLEYAGTKYLQDQAEHLTEFNIATEVFARSPQRFAATQDAVVRVEAHRLRKKLRDIYEKDTRTEGLQISLPLGTYVPKFTPVPSRPHEPATSASRRLPGWAVSAALLIVLAATIVFLVIRKPAAQTQAEATPAAAEPRAPERAARGGLTEFHAIAAYSGSEVIDSSGVRWMPDKYYAAGGHWSREGRVRGTSRPFLFTTYRTGEFGYDIPMAPGSYELRLYFVSPFAVGQEKLGGFNIVLNSKSLLEGFDIAMSANGGDIADEQVFRDIIPDENGLVRLWFSNLVGSPILNAIELTPGTPGRLKPIRILTQPTSFVDHKGQRWRADDYYLGGFRSEERRKVSGTDDPEMFGTERFGHFRYAIPVDKRGRYTVILHFAELYYGPQLPGGGGEGRRVFHVFCNGQTLLRDFDIFREAGSLRALTKTFSNIAPSAYGKINLDFEPVVNNATVSAIEVLEEPR